MQRADCDSQSVCSSRPSGSNPIVKKRRFQRFSIRQLFYASPLMGRPRRWSKKKGSVEVDARSESSLSTFTAGGGDRDGSEASRTAGSTGGGGSAMARKESVRLQAACNASQSSDPESYSASSQTPLKVNTDVELQLLECPLCLSELPFECFPKLTSCSHRSCLDCLRQYLKIEINESRVNICCPECTEPIHPTDIRMILNDDSTMNKYEEYTLRRILAKDPDTRWCPAPDCSFAVIAAGCASCPRLQCERPGCFTTFCYHCKQEWHPNQTCDAARAQRSPNIRASSVSFGQDSAQRDDIKPCPRCQVLIVKMDDGSCNHMTCAVCGAEFCWLCMKEISDLHYLSPSGCTFWGKKPWSRKKKILWQLGTLVGAPVGIALVAGIAVPAIIIGVPVWVGRKLHARYEASSKHKRNLAITGGVTASILISPILASLAVGIGVPILLAYVYGVVPISLCRSGGCGVSTSSTGVRIEFDDENDLTSGTVGQTQDAQSVDTSSHRVGNPSIGEVSFGMSASLSMGSGSHLERMGVIRDSDRESASNTAIAGASLTGSMSSGMAGGANGHRLEVQADVASNKRFSFSSETASATASLSERSTTMSLADDASTKALAGSIIGSRDPSTSFTPVEVHVDATISPVGGSQDSVVGHAKRHESVSDGAHDEIASIGRTESKGKHKFTFSDRTSTQIYECENCNVWCKDDTNSERVRFDENVSFIDDMPSDDFQAASGTSGTTVAIAASSLSEMSNTWHEPRKSVSLGSANGVDDCLKHKGLPQTSFSSRTLWNGLAAESCSNRLGETEFSKYNGRNAKISDIGGYSEVGCGLTSALKNAAVEGEMPFAPLCKGHLADQSGSRLPRSLSSSSTVQEEVIEMGSDCDEMDSTHEQVFYDAPEHS